MKRTRVLPGYTIVEVMIVLAVTGALFVSAMLLVSGQQARTEFSQGVREFESKIQDVMNDVGTGYYSQNTTRQCISSASGPVFDLVTTAEQGKSQACIYMGRALQFGTGDTYTKHTIVGLRRITAGGVTREAKDVTEAKPRSIAPRTAGDTQLPDGTEIVKLQPGLVVRWVRYDNGTLQYRGTIAFLGELGSFVSGTNLLQSQARKGVSILPISGTSIGQDIFQTATEIEDIKNNVDPSNNPVDMNPNNGVDICVEGSSRQHAIITVGGTDTPSGTSTQILEGNCPTP